MSNSFPLVYDELIRKVQFRRSAKKEKVLEMGMRATDIEGKQIFFDMVKRGKPRSNEENQEGNQGIFSKKL